MANRDQAWHKANAIMTRMTTKSMSMHRAFRTAGAAMAWKHIKPNQTRGIQRMLDQWNDDPESIIELDDIVEKLAKLIRPHEGKIESMNESAYAQNIAFQLAQDVVYDQVYNGIGFRNAFKQSGHPSGLEIYDIIFKANRNKPDVRNFEDYNLDRMPKAVDSKTKMLAKLIEKYALNLVESAHMQESKTSYPIYHKSYTSALDAALAEVKKRGYEVDEDEWSTTVTHGKRKPSSGDTNRIDIGLTKGGKPVRQRLRAQIANLDNKKFELNMYVEGVLGMHENSLNESVYGKYMKYLAPIIKELKAAGMIGQPPYKDFSDKSQRNYDLYTLITDEGDLMFQVTTDDEFRSRFGPDDDRHYKFDLLWTGSNRDTISVMGNDYKSVFSRFLQEIKKNAGKSKIAVEVMLKESTIKNQNIQEKAKYGISHGEAKQYLAKAYGALVKLGFFDGDRTLNMEKKIHRGGGNLRESTEFFYKNDQDSLTMTVYEDIEVFRIKYMHDYPNKDDKFISVDGTYANLDKGFGKFFNIAKRSGPEPKRAYYEQLHESSKIVSLIENKKPDSARTAIREAFSELVSSKIQEMVDDISLDESANTKKLAKDILQLGKMRGINGLHAAFERVLGTSRVYNDLKMSLQGSDLEELNFIATNIRDLDRTEEKDAEKFLAKILSSTNLYEESGSVGPDAKKVSRSKHAVKTLGFFAKHSKGIHSVAKDTMKHAVMLSDLGILDRKSTGDQFQITPYGQRVAQVLKANGTLSESIDESVDIARLSDTEIILMMYLGMPGEHILPKKAVSKPEVKKALQKFMNAGYIEQQSNDQTYRATKDGFAVTRAIMAKGMAQKAARNMPLSKILNESSTSKMGKPFEPKKGDKVRDRFTGKTHTVKRVYWQNYAGAGDYTVEFQGSGWNKSSNLEPLNESIDEAVRSNPKNLIKHYNSPSQKPYQIKGASDDQIEAAAVRASKQGTGILGPDLQLMRTFLANTLEESSNDYQSFFKSKLKKYNADSPADMDDATKKKFFDEIEREWTGEVNESMSRLDSNISNDDIPAIVKEINNHRLANKNKWWVWMGVVGDMPVSIKAYNTNIQRIEGYMNGRPVRDSGPMDASASKFKSYLTDILTKFSK